MFYKKKKEEEDTIELSFLSRQSKKQLADINVYNIFGSFLSLRLMWDPLIIALIMVIVIGIGAVLFLLLFIFKTSNTEIPHLRVFIIRNYKLYDSGESGLTKTAVYIDSYSLI